MWTRHRVGVLKALPCGRSGGALRCEFESCGGVRGLVSDGAAGLSRHCAAQFFLHVHSVWEHDFPL